MLCLSTPPVTRRNEVYHYNEGISCSYCIKKTSEVKKNNLQERQKQIYLAKARGERTYWEANKK